jgi:hypothetical protein
MFTVIKLEDSPRSTTPYWAVFLVNPKDETDRYMLTSPLDKQADADHFQREFVRILNQE